LKTIHLHGRLRQKFGANFKLHVNSVLEAMRCLAANFPGFDAEVVKGSYFVFIGPGKKGDAWDEERLSLYLPPRCDIHIYPAPKGGKNSGLGKIIAGVALIGIAVLSGGAATPLFGGALGAGFTGGTVALVGASLALSGVATMLTKPPKTPNTSTFERPEERQSFLLGAPTNISSEGSVIPIVGGRMRVGSLIISSGVTNEQIPV
jgi:predicted phage tail protein